MYDFVGENFPTWDKFGSNFLIINGSFHQNSNDMKFPAVQSLAISIVAIVFAHFQPISSWKRNTVNKILRFGDKFYGQCWNKLLSGLNLPDSQIPRNLQLEELLENLKISGHEVVLKCNHDSPMMGLASDEVSLCISAICNACNCFICISLELSFGRASLPFP